MGADNLDERRGAAMSERPPLLIAADRINLSYVAIRKGRLAICLCLGEWNAGPDEDILIHRRNEREIEIRFVQRHGD